MKTGRTLPSSSQSIPSTYQSLPDSVSITSQPFPAVRREGIETVEKWLIDEKGLIREGVDREAADQNGSQSSGDQLNHAPTLRDYQRVCIWGGGGDDRGPGILPALEQHRSALVVMATGSGKSVVAGALSQHEVARGGRVLMLAHREELVEQLAAKARGAGVEAEIEQGDRRGGSAPVVVASVPTLARAKRLLAWPQSAFSLVVADECHHLVAASWRAIQAHFSCAKLVGFTATPDRADGQGLGDLFAAVAYRLEIRELIAMGHLVPIRARRIVLEGVDLSRIRTRGGDLAQDELATAMATDRAVAGVTTALIEQTGQRSTVVFAASVEHAKLIAAALRSRGATAYAVHGELQREERRIMMRSFRDGEYQYLVNVDVATEGVDIPRASCIAMCRPTKSRSRYVQAAGRGLRLLGETYAESCANGKSDMQLLDFSGTAGKHRLIGPVDVLAGDVADDVRVELDALLGAGECPLEEVVEYTAAIVEERRATFAATARVRWYAEHIDLFIGEQTEIPSARSWTDGSPPSQPQLAALSDLGIEPERLPRSFSAQDATRLIGRLHARVRAGLCSYKQARKLGGYGIDTRTMTFERANQLFGILRQRGWSATSLIGQPEAGPEFHRRLSAAHAVKLAKHNRPAPAVADFATSNEVEKPETPDESAPSPATDAASTSRAPRSFASTTTTGTPDGETT